MLAARIGDHEPRAHFDLEEKIARLKREMNAVILAHFYQEAEIQDLADFVGDSLQLSQKAAATSADVIVFCGVLFMAETAKILNPGKLVLLPDLAAGCSLADGCPADEFQAFRERYPDHVSITYINCSAEVKALSDIICTSSNAEKIIRQIPPEQPILFAPDQHLGRFLMRKTGREMRLWPGSCMVHEIVLRAQPGAIEGAPPQAKVLAHPECREAVLRHADYIGSTTGILKTRERARRPSSLSPPKPASSTRWRRRARRRSSLRLHEAAASGARRRVQRVPAHEAQHDGEALRLHEGSYAGNQSGRRVAPARPASHPAHVGDELEVAHSVSMSGFMSESLDPSSYRELLRGFLEEDFGAGDITTDTVVPADRRARGRTDCQSAAGARRDRFVPRSVPAAGTRSNSGDRSQGR